MKFIETTESAWSAEQLAAAEREIEEQKREWEQNRLAAMREEEERRARELEEEGDIITFSREDATNQVSHKTKRFIKRKRSLNRTKIINKSGKRLIKRTRLSNESRFNVKRMRTKKLARKPITVKLEEPVTNCDGEDSQDYVSDDTQIHSDTENSLDSTESESNISLSTLKQVSNHIDHNSPRTRSRGTVAINLWTLDVSPILPGEKPLRKTKSNSVEKDLSDTSDKRSLKRQKSSLSEDDNSQSDEEKTLNKRNVRRKVSRSKKDSCINDVNNETGENKEGEVGELIIGKGKICKVMLSDIVAEGQYKFPEIDDGSESKSSEGLSNEANEVNTKVIENNGISTEQLKEMEVKPEESKEEIVAVQELQPQVEAAIVGPLEKLEVKSETDKEIIDAQKLQPQMEITNLPKKLEVEPEKNVEETTAAQEPQAKVTDNITVEMSTDSVPEKKSPKEKMESNNVLENNSSHLDNGLDEPKKNFPRRYPSSNTSFKSPEGRRTYRKFSKNRNNRTLDGWLKRSPAKANVNVNSKKLEENAEVVEKDEADIVNSESDSASKQTLSNSDWQPSAVDNSSDLKLKL